MDHGQQSDEHLMHLVAQGDQKALATLYDRYSGQMLGVVKRIVSEQVLAEDVLQETFWRIWDKADSFDLSKGKFTTWAFSIGRRLAIDHYRRQKIRPQAVQDERALLQLETQADSVNVASTVEQNLAAEQIQSALTTLSEPQRQAIEMAYFQGKTRQEISAETKTPLGTIHTRVRLALKNLSNELRHLREEGGRS